jgi:hypothetical protein
MDLRTPCWLPIDPLRFEPHDDTPWGWGIFTMSPALADRRPDLTARALDAALDAKAQLEPRHVKPLPQVFSPKKPQPPQQLDLL